MKEGEKMKKGEKMRIGREGKREKTSKKMNE